MNKLKNMNYKKPLTLCILLPITAFAVMVDSYIPKGAARNPTHTHNYHTKQAAEAKVTVLTQNFCLKFRCSRISDTSF